MPLIYNGININKIIYNGVEIKKIIYNEVNVWEESEKFDITFNYYAIESSGKKTISVIPGQTWADILYEDSSFFTNSVDAVIFKPNGSLNDFYVASSINPYVYPTTVITGNETLVLRARSSDDLSIYGEILLGNNKIIATGDGLKYEFIIPEDGVYSFNSISENAFLGEETLDGDITEWHGNKFEKTANANDIIIIVCATNNWNNDNYDLIIQKIS